MKYFWHSVSTILENIIHFIVCSSYDSLDISGRKINTKTNIHCL